MPSGASGKAKRSFVRELTPEPQGPRWLCKPNPSGEPPRVVEHGPPPQNTDPFVWGDAISYTFCRQGGNQKLRRLGRGSLVLFGSNLAGSFVLDTVLVVDAWLEHRKREDLVGLTSDAHMRATIEPMYGWGEDYRTFRLYFGATPKEPVEGMFSFVPCQPLDGDRSGFARPAIELDGLTDPNLRMQARVLEPGQASMTSVWRSVVDQVLDQGLALATRLHLP